MRAIPRIFELISVSLVYVTTEIQARIALFI